MKQCLLRMVGRFAVCGLLALTIVACTRTVEVTALSTPIPVFSEGDAGYACYRIPAIIRAANGDLIAFAEARRYGKQDAGDIDLVMRRSSDEGQTWGPITIIWDDSTHTCGNPAPVVVGTAGKIVMLTTWNRGEDHERDIEQRTSLDTRRAFVMHSDDHGHTWSEAREITSIVKDSTWTWYATGPCHATRKELEPHKGRIVVPANHKLLDNEGKVGARSQLLYSDDEGATWHLGAISQAGGNESTVAECSDGSLLLNMRHFERQDSLRLYARSLDGGLTWSEQGEWSDLPEPRCQGSMLNLTKGGAPTSTLLFCNPHHPRKRLNLSFSVSYDNGTSWSHLKTICEGPSAYSDIVQLDDDRIGILFENGDSKMIYRRISFAIATLKR